MSIGTRIHLISLFIILSLWSMALGSSKNEEISADLSNAIDLYRSGRYIDIVELSYNFSFNTIDGLLILAKSYENLGYYNRAYRKYREIYSRFPTYKAYVYYFIAKLLVEVGNPSEALRWYRMSLIELKTIKIGSIKDRNFFLKKSLYDVFKLYSDGKVYARDVKRIFKSNGDIGGSFTIAWYYLARVYLEEKSFKKALVYAKKIINSEVNEYFKIDLLKRLMSNEETIGMFLNNDFSTSIELLENYDLYYEIIEAYDFVGQKKNEEDLFEKEIALNYYKIGDYKNALILYNKLYHRIKDPDILVKIAYSYFYLNRKRTAKKYLDKYLSIQKHKFKFSYDAFYLKILYEISTKKYQAAKKDMVYVIKKYGPLYDMDKFLYRLFYLLIADNQLQNAIELVFLYHPYVKKDYYKAWASYILGLYVDTRYFYDAILRYPGSFYYFRSIKYINISKNRIKTADRLYDNGNFDRALNHYILLYASGHNRDYVKPKIEYILEQKKPYKYLLSLKDLTYYNSFIFRLYTLGLYSDIKELFSDISDFADPVEKYFIYYILARIYYDEKDYQKGLLYAEIISNSLNYLIFLPDNLLKMLYPIMYEDKISVELEKHNWFVDNCFVMSIIREESRYNKKALSNRGAVGLMQLMPDTASWIYKKRVSKKRLLDPEFNIEIGVEFLSYLYNKFPDCCLVLASYNGGPTNVRRWMKKFGNKNFDRNNVDKFIENIPYAETRDFVKKVFTTYSLYKEAYPGRCGQNR